MSVFRGTASAEQDGRYGDKMNKLKKTLKFPAIYSQRVDMSKVNLEVLKPWISKRLTELVGIEDDVLIEMVFNLLEEKNIPDPRELQINLGGFLERKSKVFLKELWELLLSAQANPTGIPTVQLEKKKEEIRKKRLEEAKMAEILKRKREQLERDQRAAATADSASSKKRPNRWDARVDPDGGVPPIFPPTSASAVPPSLTSDPPAKLSSPPHHKSRRSPSRSPSTPRRNRSPSPPRRNRSPSPPRRKSRRSSRSRSRSRSPRKKKKSRKSRRERSYSRSRSR